MVKRLHDIWLDDHCRIESKYKEKRKTRATKQRIKIQANSIHIHIIITNNLAKYIEYIYIRQQNTR